MPTIIPPTADTPAAFGGDVTGTAALSGLAHCGFRLVLGDRGFKEVVVHGRRVGAPSQPAASLRDAVLHDGNVVALGGDHPTLCLIDVDTDDSAELPDELRGIVERPGVWRCVTRDPASIRGCYPARWQQPPRRGIVPISRPDGSEIASIRSGNSFQVVKGRAPIDGKPAGYSRDYLAFGMPLDYRLPVLSDALAANASGSAGAFAGTGDPDEELALLAATAKGGRNRQAQAAAVACWKAGGGDVLLERFLAACDSCGYARFEATKVWEWAARSNVVQAARERAADRDGAFDYYAQWHIPTDSSGDLWGCELPPPVEAEAMSDEDLAVYAPDEDDGWNGGWDAVPPTGPPPSAEPEAADSDTSAAAAPVDDGWWEHERGLWEAGPRLRLMFDLARAREISPRALFAACAAHWAAMYLLVLGETGPAARTCGMWTLLLGASGAKKSAVADVAADLLPVPGERIAKPESFAGLRDGFFQYVDSDPESDGKSEWVWQRIPGLDGRLVDVGEAAWSEEQRRQFRRLREMWDGRTVGSDHGRRKPGGGTVPVTPHLEALTYSIGFLMTATHTDFGDAGSEQGGSWQRALVINPDSELYERLFERGTRLERKAVIDSTRPFNLAQPAQIGGHAHVAAHGDVLDDFDELNRPAARREWADDEGHKLLIRLKLAVFIEHLLHEPDRDRWDHPDNRAGWRPTVSMRAWRLAAIPLEWRREGIRRHAAAMKAIRADEGRLAAEKHMAFIAGKDTLEAAAREADVARTAARVSAAYGGNLAAVSDRELGRRVSGGRVPKCWQGAAAGTGQSDATLRRLAVLRALGR